MARHLCLFVQGIQPFQFTVHPLEGPLEPLAPFERNSTAGVPGSIVLDPGPLDQFDEPPNLLKGAPRGSPVSVSESTGGDPCLTPIVICLTTSFRPIERH